MNTAEYIQEVIRANTAILAEIQRECKHPQPALFTYTVKGALKKQVKCSLCTKEWEVIN